MEIDLENLYVDVKAKKMKDHCHLATHSKLAFLWKKSLFGWQKYEASHSCGLATQSSAF